MPTLGRFIQRRRIELGLTQEQLAEMIGGGVRQSEISRLEHDRVALPRRQRLEQIATALDVSLGELLARSGWAGADAEFDASASAQAVEPADRESGTGPGLDAPVDADIPDAAALAAAISRAERLIAVSDQIAERSQAAYGDAQRAVRYSGGRRASNGRVTPG